MLSPQALINIDTAKSIFREKLTEEEQKLYVRMPDIQLEEMKEFFDLFDEHDNGSISNEEITNVMNALGENPTPERILEMIAEIDYDSNGIVDFDEFICLMVKQMKDVDE